jgi:hypothetical protein
LSQSRKSKQRKRVCTLAASQSVNVKLVVACEAEFRRLF